MSKKQLPTFIFTPENESLPNEINPNESEEVKFSFSNFSTHFDEHINKSIRGYSDLNPIKALHIASLLENQKALRSLFCPTLQ